MNRPPSTIITTTTTGASSTAAAATGAAPPVITIISSSFPTTTTSGAGKKKVLHRPQRGRLWSTAVVVVPPDKAVVNRYCSRKTLVRVLIYLGIIVLGIDLYILWPSASGGGSFLSASYNNNNNNNNNKLLGVAAIFNSPPQQQHRIPLPQEQEQQQEQDQQFPNLLKDAGGNQNEIEELPVDSKEPVLRKLQEALGHAVTDATLIQNLPTWKQVVDVYGPKPVLIGLETACPAFRRQVPEERRMLGAAGMFSTGTNLVTHLLKQNCYIPARRAVYGVNATREELGIRWQVPWGKHTPAHYKWQHATKKAHDIEKKDVLPVVTIRNPWTWMQSMCKNHYTARWPHHKQCPNLKVTRDGVAEKETAGQNKHHHDHEEEEVWNNVTVTYGAATEHYTSLVHLFNDWYNDYLQENTNHHHHHDDNHKHNNHNPHGDSYPVLMIRLEDLVFHTQATITAICDCAGGKIYEKRPFSFVLDSAKADSPGHSSTTGYADAWIHFGRPLQRGAGFVPDDYHAALEALDQNLMDQFHYHHPPPPADAQ